MKLFIDTGSVAEVEEIAGWASSPARPRIHRCSPRRRAIRARPSRRICELVDGPVSAEVVSRDAAAWSPRAARCASSTST